MEAAALRTRASAPKATQEVTVDNVSGSRRPLHDVASGSMSSERKKKVYFNYSLAIT